MRLHHKILVGLKTIAITMVILGCSISAYALYKHVHPTITIISKPKVTNKTPAIVSSKKVPVQISNPTTTTTVVSPPKPTVTTTPVVITPPPTPVIVAVPGSSVSTLTSVPDPTPPSSGTPATSTGYTSTNWSGYISSGQSYTAVSGSWVVPTVASNSTPNSGDGTWIGIGGVTSSDLIQIGTDDSVNSTGQVTSSAFYETLPQSSRTINTMTVSEGDAMTASINEVSTGQWTLSISDTTSGQSFTTSISYSSSNSSAEWIEEDPGYLNGAQVPFDEYGELSFTNATTMSGNTGYTLSTSNAEPVTLVDNNGNALSTPSALGTDGESFTITRTN
jgi:hypothetical protein